MLRPPPANGKARMSRLIRGRLPFHLSRKSGLLFLVSPM